MTLKIGQISIEETYPIRKEVLRKNIPLPYKFDDDFDKNTFHLGVFYNKKLVSISSFIKAKNEFLSGEQYQLRGMATINSQQKKGIGSMIIKEAIELLKKIKVDVLWCNARVSAVNYYKKHGFQIIGSEFDVKHIGKHFVMYKKID